MLYVRLPLSPWNVEGLLRERGIDVSQETIRFGGIDLARSLPLRSAGNGYRIGSGIHWQWHYLWRAVDHEGEMLESYVTKRRDRKAALKFLRKSMKRHGQPQVIVTDRLRSYGAAMKLVGKTPTDRRRAAG